ncbi:MAG: OsmC family protein [Flavobacteriales bacterium]|nr:OsmC family protein [Flavobacteriales bacterium]
MKYNFNYSGKLNCKVEHLGNHKIIETDAPKDNNGRGEAFSPTDLLASSLVTCMMTIMGIHASKKGMPEIEMEGSFEKVMSSNPRRVQEVNGHINVTLPKDKDSESVREFLVEKAHQCPVALSVHPELVQKIDINFL